MSNSNSSNLSNKIYSFKRNMRKQQIQKKCQQKRNQLITKNQQQTNQNNQLHNQKININALQSQSNNAQLIDQFDKPFKLNELQTENIKNFDFAHALTQATNFQLDGTNKQQIRSKINFIALIYKFWQEEKIHPYQGLPNQGLTKNQSKVIKILEKLNHVLNQEQIYYTLEIYTFIMKKSMFHYLVYIGFPIASFLKEGIITHRVDQIISLIFNYIENHHFKKAEYFGELIHYATLILSYFLNDIFQQKHLISTISKTLNQNKNKQSKFYLSLGQIICFYNHVSSFAEKFLHLGNYQDIQNIIFHLLFSINILRKMHKQQKSYFHIEPLKSMINILYVAHQIAQNHFEQNHQYLLNLIYEILRYEPHRIIQFKEETLLDAYLVKLILQGQYGKQKIEKIIEISQSQNVQLQAMGFKSQKQRLNQIQKSMQRLSMSHNQETRNN